MKEDNSRRSEMTPEEIQLHQDLYMGEGSEGIDRLDTYLAAKSALFASLDEAMQGEGESSAETLAHLGLLLAATGESYAVAVGDTDMPEETIRYAAELLQCSLREIKVIAQKYECDNVEIHDTPLDETIEFIEEDFNDSDDDTMTNLKNMYGIVHQSVINGMLANARSNENDLRRMRRDHIKTSLLEGAIDTAKIAIGATAAALIVRFIDRRKS